MGERIPMERVIERLDRCNDAGDSEGAIRLLAYWREEARSLGDERGELTVVNELMGAYRKAGDGEKAVACAEDAIALIEKQGIGDTVSAATIRINCATVYTAFSRAKEAIVLFEEAEAVYTRQLGNADTRLGSLYNNMATCCKETGEYARAEEAYGRALEVMSRVPGSEPERAVTELNLANLLEAAHGMRDACERIEGCVQRAHDLLEGEEVERNGHYAFVAEKCAPAFAYYGWFAYADELKRRAAAIYAGNGDAR